MRPGRFKPGSADRSGEAAYRTDLDGFPPDLTESRQIGGQGPVPGRWDAEREHRRSGDGRLVLVAEDEPGHVVAFNALEPDGHIDRPFCAPEVAGRGVASRLYDAIETAARAQGIQRLFTEASELARRFFERKGFMVLERQEMTVRGAPIHNYRMAKTLGLGRPRSRLR